MNDIQTIAPVGPAAGAKMRDDVNGGKRSLSRALSPAPWSRSSG